MSDIGFEDNVRVTVQDRLYVRITCTWFEVVGVVEVCFVLVQGVPGYTKDLRNVSSKVRLFESQPGYHSLMLLLYKHVFHRQIIAPSTSNSCGTKPPVIPVFVLLFRIALHVFWL
jgi:hypothetical protein